MATGTERDMISRVIVDDVRQRVVRITQENLAAFGLAIVESMRQEYAKRMMNVGDAPDQEEGAKMVRAAIDHVLQYYVVNASHPDVTRIQPPFGRDYVAVFRLRELADMRGIHALPIEFHFWNDPGRDHVSITYDGRSGQDYERGAAYVVKRAALHSMLDQAELALPLLSERA